MGLAPRSWVVLCTTAVLGTLAGTATALTGDTTYRARTEVFVTVAGPPSLDPALAVEPLVPRLATYADLATGPRVLQPVIDDLGLPTTAESLVTRVHAMHRPGTLLIDITATDPDAARSAIIANAVAERLSSVVAELEAGQDASQSPVTTSVVTQAAPPVRPDTPLPRNPLIGLAIGTALGAALVLLRRYLDHSVRTAERAGSVSGGVDVLGAIAERRDASPDLLTDLDTSPWAESLRRLRTNIGSTPERQAPRSLVVTSSVPHEGRTSTACNLAVALAQAGESVVLIDADLRRPTVHDVFALSAGVGLTTVLLGDLPVTDALQPWRDDLALRVLTAGPIPPNPADLIGSERMRALIGDLTEAGATVVLDSPPLLPVTDAALLARASDGALVVTRAASTHVEQLAAACESLRIAGATVLGVVLNRVPRKRGSAYYGGYDGYRGYRSTTVPSQTTVPTPAAPPVAVPAATDAPDAGVSAVRSMLRPPAPTTSPAAPALPDSLPPGVTLIPDPIPAVPREPRDHERATAQAPWALPDEPVLPAHAVPDGTVPDLVELPRAPEPGTRRPRLRPRREAVAHERAQRAGRGDHTAERAAPNGQAPSPTPWTQPPAVRSQVLHPEPAPQPSPDRIGDTGDIALHDLVINADHPTISRLDPVGDTAPSVSTWHIEWGDLPALVTSPRNGHGPHTGPEGGPGTGARHRN